jgi:pimeloyl-ACP methyl ester carboxylesterase
MATTPGLPHARLPQPRTLAKLVGVGLARRRDDPARALSKLLLPKKLQPRAKELFAKWPAAMREDPTDPRAFFGQLAAAATHSTGARLPDVRCPAVVVTGEEDILIPPKNSHVIASLIPGAHLEVLPDVGHGIPLVDESVVHRALERLRAKK